MGICIMRRTQLYLDDHLWDALHARAQRDKTTISELAREAARERYLGKQDEPRRAVQEFVGTRAGHGESEDATQYIRSLRRGRRLDRLRKRDGSGRFGHPDGGLARQESGNRFPMGKPEQLHQ